MGAIGIVLLCFVAFVAMALYQNHKNQKLRKICIQRGFGKLPEREYNLDEYECISHYFRQRKKQGYVIDDITWNDLDMDSVFIMMNHTWSAIGESSLYDLLRRPEFSEEILGERERLIQFFQTHETEREKFLELCAEIGKTNQYSIFDYIYNLADLETEKPWKHYLNILLIIGTIGLIFIHPQVGILSLIIMISLSMGQYYGAKRESSLM